MRDRNNKLTTLRSDIYIVQYMDGSLERNVPGNIWKIQVEEKVTHNFFEKYPYIGFKPNWIERYNQVHGTDFKIKSEAAKHAGGKDKFTAFKREYAHKNFPQIQNYVVVQAAPLTGWKL